MLPTLHDYSASQNKQHDKTGDTTVTNGKFATTFCYVTVNWILF